MKVEILGIDMRINPILRAAIEQKMSKFERFFDDSARGEVKLQPEGAFVRAEVTFKIQALYFRAESVASDAMTAVEQAIDNLEGQIRKNKTRMKKRMKDFSSMEAYFDNEEALGEGMNDEDEFRIIRRKSFTMSEMTPDEAVLQMELLGHSFLLFLSAETNRVCAVYKRVDGDYGLLEPEY
ncbi:MAG TPA: ribosome-associated translation inhibitor RaiA [Bacillota bacterium]|jgi:putative sigma-54 modulation protein|nr:ribosome-associated translation inhibitor RaiA [Fastidiosipila sp.]HPX92855.1 ribosome-associated translation inhibitor RaiA [Bacillota bacterium]HQB81340.1 ribosome-associated translation inhibitor RaiA [Bacillota bacterium]